MFEFTRPGAVGLWSCSGIGQMLNHTTSLPSTSCRPHPIGGEGVAAKALESLGISLEAVRHQVEEIIGQGQTGARRGTPVHAAGQEVCGICLLRRGASARHNTSGYRALLASSPRGEGVASQVLVASARTEPGPHRHKLAARPGKEPAAAVAPSEPPVHLAVLYHFGRNLTAACPLGQARPVHRPENEIDRVMQVLSRRTKNNPCLWASHGVANGRLRAPGP